MCFHTWDSAPCLGRLAGHTAEFCIFVYTCTISTFEPCNVETSLRISKWWEMTRLLLTVIRRKTSASGEVEASQNMAE